MSRTDKDRGWASKWYCGSPKAWAKFYRSCRRIARAKAKDDLRNGREPAPRYPVEYAYFD